MRLKEFAKDYTLGMEGRDIANIISFVHGWEKHLNELKQQYIDDKPSLHPDDSNQAKRNLMSEKVIDIVGVMNNLMNIHLTTSPTPSFPKGGIINGAGIGEERIIVDGMEEVIKPDKKTFDHWFNDMSHNIKIKDKE